MRAERYTTPSLFVGNGDLCVGSEPGPIKFDKWRLARGIPPMHPSPDVYEYAVDLHVTAFGPAAGDIGSNGWHNWFLEVQKQSDGYRLVAGGTGP